MTTHKSVFKGTTFNLSGELLEEVQSSGYNYFVYILLCSDGSYYTGLTNNLEARLSEHSDGDLENCYTYTRRPVELKYFELYHNIFDAIRRENQIKRWSRKKKEALFRSDYKALGMLSKTRREPD